MLTLHSDPQAAPRRALPRVCDARYPLPALCAIGPHPYCPTCRALYCPGHAHTCDPAILFYLDHGHARGVTAPWCQRC